MTLSPRSSLLYSVVLLAGFLVGFIGIQIVADSGDNIWLADYTVRTASTGDHVFTGTFENRAGNPVSSVQAKIIFLAHDGTPVDALSAWTPEFGPDGRWTFSMPMPPSGAAGFRVERLTWKDEAHGREYAMGPYGPRPLRAP